MTQKDQRKSPLPLSLFLHLSLYLPLPLPLPSPLKILSTVSQEIRTAQTFAAFPVHYRIHLYVAASFATADKITAQDISSKAAMLDLLKSRSEDQRHIIGAFELLCMVSNTVESC